jgi:hypothetical protein
MTITRRQALLIGTGAAIWDSGRLRAAAYIHVWNFGGSCGARLFEAVHRIMGVSAPISVSATGLYLLPPRSREIPDVLHALYEYPGFILRYEAWRTSRETADGIRFFSRNGAVSIIEPPDGAAALQSARIERLSQIAFQTGRKLQWDAARENLLNDNEASRLLRQVMR